MKDPLQHEETAYEVLRIPRDSGPSDVTKSFQRAIAEKWAPVPKLRDAYNRLQRPVDRALIDVLLFDPAVLRRLSPCPLDDPAVLAPSQRARTAAAWQNSFQQALSDLGIAHSLAVLWYWWVVSVEDIGAEALSGSGTPALDTMWRYVIGYWTVLTSADNFWTGALQVPVESTPTVRAAVHDRLVQKLSVSADKARGRGSSIEVNKYKALSVALAVEKHAAAEIVRAGISINGNKLCCGPIMLGNVGKLAAVRSWVGTQVEKNPSDEHFLKLRSLLSPYAHVFAHLEGNRPTEALEALDCLPSSEAGGHEASELRARCLLARGKQEASLGEWHSALSTWESALAIPEVGGLRKTILFAVTETAKHRAAEARSGHHLDEAIAILELGVGLGAATDLSPILAEDVTTRGVDKMNAAIEENKSAGCWSPENRTTLSAGLHDIERGASLGSRRAENALATARDWVAISERSEAPSVPQDSSRNRSDPQEFYPTEASDGIGEVIGFLMQADLALNRGDANTAARLTAEAIRIAGPNPSSEVRTVLAAFISKLAPHLEGYNAEGATRTEEPNVLRRLWKTSAPLLTNSFFQIAVFCAISALVDQCGK